MNFCLKLKELRQVLGSRVFLIYYKSYCNLEGKTTYFLNIMISLLIITAL